MARRSGVSTPVIRDITPDTIAMERIHGIPLKEAMNTEFLKASGMLIGRLHSAGIIHGDLTTSNILVRDGRCVLIDFGLATVSSELEARGVDIHVLFQTLESTSGNAGLLKDAFVSGYRRTFPGADDVLEREQEILLRGRYL
jgi:N6-L-threonylcarbamoyladenine synthase/protein kinase Bud32